MLLQILKTPCKHKLLIYVEIKLFLNIFEEQIVPFKIIDVNFLLGEYKVRYRGGEGDGPAEDAHDGGPLDVGEGEDVERGADGEVALQREREDGQHRGVRGAEICNINQ